MASQWPTNGQPMANAWPANSQPMASQWPTNGEMAGRRIINDFADAQFFHKLSEIERVEEENSTSPKIWGKLPPKKGSEEP